MEWWWKVDFRQMRMSAVLFTPCLGLSPGWTLLLLASPVWLFGCGVCIVLSRDLSHFGTLHAFDSRVNFSCSRNARKPDVVQEKSFNHSLPNLSSFPM